MPGLQTLLKRTNKGLKCSIVRFGFEIRPETGKANQTDTMLVHRNPILKASSKKSSGLQLDQYRLMVGNLGVLVDSHPGDSLGERFADKEKVTCDRFRTIGAVV